jgi:hypothetical protein
MIIEDLEKASSSLLIVGGTVFGILIAKLNNRLWKHATL